MLRLALIGALLVVCFSADPTTAVSTSKPTQAVTDAPTVGTSRPTAGDTPTTGKPTTATEKPTTATAKPTTATEKPTTATEKPTTATARPTTATEKPTTATEKPTTATAKPTTADIPTTARPTTATEKPTTATAKPTTATAKPTTSTAKPTTADTPTTGKPTTATAKPTTGKPTTADTPTTGKPTTATAKPTTSTAKPTTSTAKPTTADTPTTGKPTTATAKPTTGKPTTSKDTTAKPTTGKPTTATSKDTTARPTSKDTTANPTSKDGTARPTSKDTTANPTSKDGTARPTSKDTTANPTSKNETSTAKPTSKDSTSTARPTSKDETSTAKPTSKNETSTAKPTSKNETSTARPTKETSTSVETTKSETTTTDDHGSYSCENLDFYGCIKYSRCAWIVTDRSGESDCEIECGSCIDTEYYGTCNDYRKRVSSGSGSSDIKKVICSGDSIDSKDGTAKCFDDKCKSLGYEDCLEKVNLDGPGCVWVVTGDVCVGNNCGICSYAPAPCEKYKNCFDNTEYQWTTTYYCSDSASVVDCPSKTADPSCNYDCKSYTYSDCIKDNSCAWINNKDFYEEKENCPSSCGYCSPACQYGINGTCEEAKVYYECQQSYQNNDDGTTESSTVLPVSTGVSKEQTVYCEGDEAPENSARCFVDDRSNDDSLECKKLGYDDCINAVATDNNGGCAWVVNTNCYSSCGYCTAVPYSCSDYKTCHDFDSQSGNDGKNNWRSTTYYCGDEEPTTKNCEKYQTECSGWSYEDCLKGGSDGHCAWYQYESFDNRCGWCGFVCDSCENEQNRIAESYGEDEYFYGASYHVLCDSTDNTLIKDCRNCYGKKSRCANALCAEEVKACNADKDCSDSAFKAMCLDYGESDGSYFYADIVDKDDIVDNTTTAVFALCMKKNCFDDNDEEIVKEFESQTTGVTCSFGYAKLEVLFEVCLTTSNLAYLCSQNYALNFRNVMVADTGASVNWDFTGSKCDVFGITDDETEKRRLQSQTTEDPTNPWDKITQSTGTPEPVPTRLDCLEVQIIVTYPNKDSYESDLTKFDSIQSRASRFEPNGQVQFIENSIECCVEDDVCKNYRSAGAILHSFIAIVIACASLLFL